MENKEALIIFVFLFGIPVALNIYKLFLDSKKEDWYGGFTKKKDIDKK